MRILVVEDDPNINRQLSIALGHAGYAVECAMDGEQGHYFGDTAEYDAVVLDLGLPVIGGMDVLRRWREAGRTMPVLILTAVDLWSDKVAAIDSGADDYLTKPFAMAELLARLRALIRRRNGFSDAMLVSGDIRMDTRSGEVTRGGAAIILTRLEQRLLHFLMHRAGSVVGRTEIIEHIYTQDADRDSNTVEVFIGRLRAKLGADAIETLRGAGYRMAPGADVGRDVPRVGNRHREKR